MEEKRVKGGESNFISPPTSEQQPMVMSSSTETKYPEYQKFLDLHGDEIKLCFGKIEETQNEWRKRKRF